MKKLATGFATLAIAAVAFGNAASAAPHANSLDMSATEVQQLIQNEGSVILHTGADTFNRYVADGSNCLVGERTQNAFVPTADSSSAFVGYTCEENADEG